MEYYDVYGNITAEEKNADNIMQYVNVHIANVAR